MTMTLASFFKTHIFTLDILITLVAVLLLVLLSLRKKALTLPAACTASVMMLCICICSGYGEVLFLILSYLIIVAVDTLFRKQAEEKVRDVHKKSGARGVIQILANGSVAVLCTVLYAITRDAAFLLAYIMGVSEACADSLASDIGVLSKKKPVSILTFKRIDTGISGGVSLLGLASSLTGCIVMSGIALLCMDIPLRLCVFAILTAVPFLGMLIDSVLGASVQAKFRCCVCGKNTEKDTHCGVQTEHVGGLRFMDNSLVNLVTNLITVIIGFATVKFLL